MKVETRNTIPVGQAPATKDTVRVSETVYIAEGDSVAVMRLGNVPLILPVRSKNRRQASKSRYESHRPTARAPAPPYVTPVLLTLELAEKIPRPANVPNIRRSRFVDTIVPPPRGDE